MSKNKRTIIVALAVVILLGFVSPVLADTYCEQWNQGWGSGSITYNGRTYNHTGGESGMLYCEGEGYDEQYDLFCPNLADWCVSLIWTSGQDADTINLVDATYNSHENIGYKEHGQGGQSGGEYDGYGEWCGYDSDKNLYIWGTWTTLNDNDDDFVYGGLHVSWSPWGRGDWAVDSDQADSVTGSGRWYMERTSNTPGQPCPDCE